MKDTRIILFKTDTFEKWFRKIKDKQTKMIIQVHLDRIIENKLGKIRFLGNKVYEKKINYGPGYRLYLTNHKDNIILLLCGGNKSTQKDDIKKAKIMAKNVK